MNFMTLVYLIASIMLLISFVIVFITYQEVKKVIKANEKTKLNRQETTVYKIKNNNLSNSLLGELSFIILPISWLWHFTKTKLIIRGI